LNTLLAYLHGKHRDRSTLYPFDRKAAFIGLPCPKKIAGIGFVIFILPASFERSDSLTHRRSRLASWIRDTLLRRVYRLTNQLFTGRRFNQSISKNYCQKKREKENQICEYPFFSVYFFMV
jgi:hypothetical protein